METKNIKYNKIGMIYYLTLLGFFLNNTIFLCMLSQLFYTVIL